MDRTTRAFIVASLVYLTLAAILGVWMGVGAVPSWARFAHVHFNLLGFMAMMVYGVGYFVLPRFNARDLRWPSWVPLHFWTANVGLLGMVATYPGSPSPTFVAFSGLTVLSVLLFAVNMGVTLLSAEEQDEAKEGEEHRGAPQTQVSPQTRVGEILTRWPETAEVFVANGFDALADEAHREQVKSLPITLEMACQRHGVDLDRMVALLRETVEAAGTAATPRIRADQVLGAILEAYPETEEVFRKYYGSGCFSCPGQKTETVKQSAMIHNVDLDRLLEDLNRQAA